MPRNEEYDWMFDYVLQFLESEKFDAAIMDFVDEKCFVFDDSEENKLIYTEIHKEFCDHVEALLSSNLNEVGISNDQFLESCEKARSGRDINATVFERLIAMDDFQTFKKIMTKRNTELQLEAIKSFSVNTPYPAKSSSKKFFTSQGEGKTHEDFDEQLMDPEELMALKEAEIMSLTEGGGDSEEVQEMLLQSLMEMEFIHRQEELEHAELERALLLSLIAEEERLHALMMEAKASMTSDNDRAEVAALPAEMKAESKSSPSNNNEPSSSAPINISEEKGGSAKKGPRKSSNASGGLAALDALPDIKSMKLKTDLKPLPSIKGVPGGGGVGLEDLAEKKRQTEGILRKGMEQLSSQRKNEEELRQKLDPSEVDRRERHMKEMRDRIIAKKKAERDQKVAAEEERKRKLADGENLDNSKEGGDLPRSRFNHLMTTDNNTENDSKAEDEEIAEMRRATMRMALARRLKMDLIESEEAKRNEIQETQFAELDKKLQAVEQLREDNRKREYILNRQLERQQEQVARNIELSAAMMSRHRDDVN